MAFFCKRFSEFCSNNTASTESRVTNNSNIHPIKLRNKTPTFAKAMNYKIESLNTEQAELLEQGKLLPVMEDFYTIQGEGFNSGKAAYFIRVGGCDVGCHWCDVKESWDASVHPLVKVEDVVKKVVDSGSKAVVITGGEPLQYNMDHITAEFRKKNIETFIETSGAYPLTGDWDWICLSPKKTMHPLADVYKKADELKVIVYNKNDFEWAQQEAEKVNKECLLFLQPEWSKNNEMMPLIVEFVKTHQNWMVSLQSHKYMNIP
jgi:7-carboxy-7-deazaguanine synthase